MVAHTHLSLPASARRVLLVALTCLLVGAAMMLSASGASARTRMCPRVNAPIASLASSGVQHAGVCAVGRERVGRHLPVLLPSRQR